MKSPRWLIGCAAGLLLAAGCDGPPDTIPVVPPGETYVPDVPTPEGGGAQALGEQGAQAMAEGGIIAKISAVEPNPPTAPGVLTRLKSGIGYVTLKPGRGRAAASGDIVSVQYTGSLEDNTVFESSRTGNLPYTFKLGGSTVIAGWDQGIPGMLEHEIRRLIIPGHLAYGPSGRSGKIPPNATLIFEVELEKVEPGPPANVKPVAKAEAGGATRVLPAHTHDEH